MTKREFGSLDNPFIFLDSAKLYEYCSYCPEVCVIHRCALTNMLDKNRSFLIQEYVCYKGADFRPGDIATFNEKNEFVKLQPPMTAIEIKEEKTFKQAKF